MKNIILALLLLCFLSSCDKENPESIERYFYLNSEISAPDDNMGMYVNWAEGDKTVFRYILTHPDEEDIADDELSEVFWIEVPSNLTTFQFDNTDLSQTTLEAYYTRSCFCYFEAFQFEKLEITGKKKNNGSWEVSFDMIATRPNSDNEFVLKDSGVYRLAQPLLPQKH